MTANGGPQFLGIGAQRSGSTWLDWNLRAHPGIWLPPLKELHYFDEMRSEPLLNRRYRQHFRRRVRGNIVDLLKRRWSWRQFRWDVRYLCHRRSDRWYASLFAHVQDRVAGEITPAYSMLDRDVVQAVHRVNPELRIIFIMRDPIDRSWSQAVKELAYERGRSPADLSESEIVSFLRSPACLLRSNYVRTLDNWSAHFPTQQILPLFFEEIKANPAGLMMRVAEFLGVEPPADVVDEPVNVIATGRAELPAAIARELATIHAPMLKTLAERFGAHPTAWYERALRVPDVVR